MANPIADTLKGSPPPHAQTGARFRTFAGTIAQGMDVISPEGRFLGRVDRIEGDHIVLVAATEREGDVYFVPLSLIDGIDQDQILLASRGDGTFGLGAEP